MTESAVQEANASSEQMEEMATDELEDENIQPAELSAEEQIRFGAASGTFQRIQVWS